MLKNVVEARAKMIVDLGLKRSAYDWRSQHVASLKGKSFSVKNTESSSLLSGMLTQMHLSYSKNMASNLKSGARLNLPNQATRNLRLMRQQNL